MSVDDQRMVPKGDSALSYVEKLLVANHGGAIESLRLILLLFLARLIGS
jgi:hypothetical protein